MQPEKRIAIEWMKAYPGEAARVVESLPASSAAGVLSEVRPPVAGPVLGSMSPLSAAGALREFEPEGAAAVITVLPADVSAMLLRRAGDMAGPILERLAPPNARRLRAVLAFPEGTAGSMMDPLVVALSDGITIAAALQQIRTHPEHVRYNVYFVDSAQTLTGVMTLRELLVAKGAQAVSRIMKRPTQFVLTTADRWTIARHPGWKDVHALPVIDNKGRYHGAIRYRTLRQIEAQLRGDEAEGLPTAAALGDLIRAGLLGVMEAIGVPEEPGGNV